jgi:serine/threonine-protein kinase
MDSARWQRIQALFHRAADLPADEQRALLDAECAGDRELADQVEALLAEDARGTSLLDRGIAQVASDLLEQSEREPLPPGSFGPYRLTRLLGEGGMGVVYQAERSDLGSRAAIKVLRDAWLSPARRERFTSEQRTLAQLHHASIAQLYDADVLPDGTPWFAMEYVEGVPLTEYARTRAKTVPARLRLFRAVCEAVQYAHSLAVIHRDLKPSNVLVTGDGTVKLLDFGIAKHLDAGAAPADQTRTGLRLMTPAYAAPEQIRGERVGVHTDVYSLGVMLYELLAGRLPFDLSSRTPGEAEAVILQQEPEKPSVAAQATAATAGPGSRSDAPTRREWADLDVLCLTAMHKDPARRYRTVDALIRDTDHFLANQPLLARPDTLGYRVGKFVGRNRGPVAAAALVSTLVVGLVVFYTVRLTIARNAAIAEAARTQRVLAFTLNLFEGGDKEAGPADSLRVLTLVDRGLQEARSLGSDPAVQAELYVTLGGIYQKLGNLARADTLLGAALETRRRIFGNGSAEVTGSLVALGLLRVDQANFPDGERLIREALDQGRAKLPPGHPALARATFALGLVLQERGKYAEAIPVSEEAVRYYSAPSGAATAELSASLGQLADDHFYLGQLDASDSVNRIVLAMNRQLYGERHPRVADILINLGAAEQDRGHYAEAERFDRQSLDIIRGFYGEEHYQTADALTKVARALVFQNKFEEGVPMLRRALAIRERVFGPVHPMVASTLNELGNTAMRQDHPAEAEPHFRRMLDIYRAVYGEKHYLIGIAESNLAGSYLAQKQFPQAETLFRQAIAMFTETQSATHTNTGIARIKLGRVLLRQRRYADAAAEGQAGYDILSKQMAPGVTWLVNARKDLAEAYDSLRQPAKAAKFRAELADSVKKPSTGRN